MRTVNFPGLYVFVTFAMTFLYVLQKLCMHPVIKHSGKTHTW